MGGAFWSAFVGCPANASDMTPASYAPVVRATLQQLDLFAQLRALHPRVFPRTSTVSAALAGFHAGAGERRRMIAPVGIEGLHQIGGSPATLRLYHALGARYASLTWNCHNAYADAAVGRGADGRAGAAVPLWGGLSPAGRELVLEMNRLGMLVDLAHASADTMRDVLAGSSASEANAWKGSVAPPMFSHSSAWALCPHPRNVPDDVLLLVKKRNSVVMVNFSADFISCTPSESPSGLPDPYPQNATLAQVVRHIVHIGSLIGYDHVGIGSDFDGIELTPRGLEDVSKFPDLVAALLREGISETDVIKIIGGNILRVWREAEAVSDMMKLVRHPLEDDI
jgi:membrane dipeptidase